MNKYKKILSVLFFTIIGLNILFSSIGNHFNVKGDDLNIESYGFDIGKDGDDDGITTVSLDI